MRTVVSHHAPLIMVVLIVARAVVAGHGAARAELHGGLGCRHNGR
jgi:hypothetical protein